MSSSPLPATMTDNDEEIEMEEENVSVLDPRRFTPSLHANLVSEILSLRRDVDSKNSLILSLEEHLTSAEQENEQLIQTINTNLQENRGLRRKLQLLEGGSDNAKEILVEERDTANETLVELKRRFEAVQKKLKTRDDEVDRMNALWDSDKQHWDEQKRAMDRKVHIAETRMRTLLQELETMHLHGLGARRDSAGSDKRPGSGTGMRPFSRASGVRSAQSHRRDGSVDSCEGNVRFSRDDPASRRSILVGTSLADELNFGSEDDPDTDGYASPGALPEESVGRIRPFSAQSSHESAKARKLLGLSMVEDEGNIQTDNKQTEGQPKTRSPSCAKEVAAVSYVHASTQWSPPVSPTLQPQALDTIAEAESVLEHDFMPSLSRSSFDGGSRTPVDIIGTSSSAGIGTPKRVSMVSQACQTIEQPPSPPATPRSISDSTWSVQKPDMISNATQTVEDPPSIRSSLDARTRPGDHIDVPVISIRRPSTSNSKRSSFYGVVLPPQTRNAGCQVNVAYESASVQADLPFVSDIQLPEMVPVLNLSGQVQPPSARRFSSETISARNSLPVPTRRATQGSRVSSLVKSFEYDDKQSVESEAGRIRRSARLSRYEDVFADFDGEHDMPVNQEEMDIGNLTDDSAASKEPIRKILRKTRSGWKTMARHNDPRLEQQLKSKDLDDASPRPASESSKVVVKEKKEEFKEVNTLPEVGVQHSETSASNQISAAVPPEQSLEPQSETVVMKAPKAMKKSKEPDIRKIALISSGTAAHAMKRPRSPSAPAASTVAVEILDPPFPVPDRHSSKKLSYEDDPLSTPSGTVKFYGGGIYGRKHVKKRTKKTVRSGSLSRSPQRKDRKATSDRSPPLSPSTLGFSSVTSGVTSRRSAINKVPGEATDSVCSLRGRPSNGSNPASTSRQGSTIASVQGSTMSESTSVVDAIAQTMVGEWMWKYVRRRKSFGLPETPAAEFELGKVSDANAARHQRWVWLAPYERAVMWSSKQPTSGPALMGKSGRKLIIQSVLDVRDDTPMPKGADPASHFGRSILILTAQRALKFTAMSRERHYIWLTALSFLSHSSALPQALAAVPAMPSRKPPPPPPPMSNGQLNQRLDQLGSIASLQRSKVHDSILVAKGKNRPSLNPLAGSSRRAYTTPLKLESSQPGFVPAEVILDGIDSADDAAEPPLVPRFANHQRKRSNTGVAAPSARSFKSFTSSQANTSKPSVNTYAASAPSEAGASSYTGGWVTDSGTTRGSFLNNKRRPDHWKKQFRLGSRHESNGGSQMESANTSPTDGIGGNFFEAIGTMRMEAFVQGIDRMADETAPARKTKGGGEGSQLHKQRSGEFERKRERTRPKDVVGRKKTESQHWNNHAEKGKERPDAAGISLPGLDPVDPFDGF